MPPSRRLLQTDKIIFFLVFHVKIRLFFAFVNNKKSAWLNLCDDNTMQENKQWRVQSLSGVCEEEEGGPSRHMPPSGPFWCHRGGSPEWELATFPTHCGCKRIMRWPRAGADGRMWRVVTAVQSSSEPPAILGLSCQMDSDQVLLLEKMQMSTHGATQWHGWSQHKQQLSAIKTESCKNPNL